MDFGFSEEQREVQALASCWIRSTSDGSAVSAEPLATLDVGDGAGCDGSAVDAGSLAVPQPRLDPSASRTAPRMLREASLTLLPPPAPP